jgi:hypothetical protein
VVRAGSIAEFVASLVNRNVFQALENFLGPLGVFRVSERERGVCVAVLGNQAPEFSVYHMPRFESFLLRAKCSTGTGPLP